MLQNILLIQADPADDDGTEVEVLLKNADFAMYQAKDCGRNNYQFNPEEVLEK